MEGHQYVALRRLVCEDGGKEAVFMAGDKLPTRITDKWAPSAVRAMVNQSHIQFAQIEDTKTLPYLAKKPKQKGGKAA